MADLNKFSIDYKQWLDDHSGPEFEFPWIISTGDTDNHGKAGVVSEVSRKRAAEYICGPGKAYWRLATPEEIAGELARQAEQKKINDATEKTRKENLQGSMTNTVNIDAGALAAQIVTGMQSAQQSAKK